MEFVLNLAWVLLAVCMLCLWLRFAPRTVTDRRMQVVALAVLISVLLPAISMTDDLLAAQSPAEVVTSVRRDHDDSSPHYVVPVAVVPLLVLFSGLALSASPFRLTGELPSRSCKSPALSSIQNRPPPAA